jgi:hypothetical protein
MTKRALTVRLLSLEVGPMVGGVALLYFFPQRMPLVFAVVALAIFAGVALCIRDGVVLERGGTVCERRKDSAGFWVWIALHAVFGLFFFAGAALTFLRP